MKIELKTIIDQLSEAIDLKKGYKVSALIDKENNNELIGWTIVQVFEDGQIKSVSKNFNNLKELFSTYKKQ